LAGCHTAVSVAIAPEIPTIAESGIPAFDVNPWWGILAPAGTDMAIVRKINSDVASVLRTKEMIDFLAARGVEPSLPCPKSSWQSCERTW
jgi:tripartite-type tricarboxylate transporter receptor subunit TctC